MAWQERQCALFQASRSPALPVGEISADEPVGVRVKPRHLRRSGDVGAVMRYAAGLCGGRRCGRVTLSG